MDIAIGTTTAIIIAAAAGGVVLLGLIAIVWVAMRRRRRHQRLQEQFGAEYDRTMRRTGDRKAAEHELEQRVERVQGFELEPISEDEALRFETRWKLVKADFVDHPHEAVLRADALLVELMATRGYADAGAGPDNRAADISVSDPELAEEYRQARAAADRGRNGDVSTEELRRAMLRLRRVFESLLDRRTATAAAPSRGAREPVAAR